MVKLRMAAAGALLLACVLAGKLAVAGESPIPRSPSSCLEITGQVPQPTWRPTDGCYIQSFCTNVDYCWSICSTASTADCINNVCYFTFPSGPGSSSNDCPNQRLCRNNSDCVFEKGTPDPPLYGVCVNGTCVC
jgi:hypothetical protein